MLKSPTPKEFLKCRLTPDIEFKLLYILQNVSTMTRIDPFSIAYPIHYSFDPINTKETLIGLFKGSLVRQNQNHFTWIL
jgi:hypothetical protein